MRWASRSSTRRPGFRRCSRELLATPTEFASCLAAIFEPIRRIAAGWWTNKNNSCLLTCFDKICIFREKAITGMDSLLRRSVWATSMMVSIASSFVQREQGPISKLRLPHGRGEHCGQLQSKLQLLRIPISRHVAIIRTAISPRLAIKILLNIFTSYQSCFQQGSTFLQEGTLTSCALRAQRRRDRFSSLV